MVYYQHSCTHTGWFRELEEWREQAAKDLWPLEWFAAGFVVCVDGTDTIFQCLDNFAMHDYFVANF